MVTLGKCRGDRFILLSLWKQNRNDGKMWAFSRFCNIQCFGSETVMLKSFRFMQNTNKRRSWSHYPITDWTIPASALKADECRKSPVVHIMEILCKDENLKIWTLLHYTEKLIMSALWKCNTKHKVLLWNSRWRRLIGPKLNLLALI